MQRAPKYPRIPHLGTIAQIDPDDRVLSAADRAALLAGPVIVEEKLDGANVALWFDGGVLHVASRGGVETGDRGHVLGRLRAWALPRSDQLRDALGDGLALYAEWLLARHTVPYDLLPAPLVGLDVLDAATGRFLTVAQRDRVLARGGLAGPPRLFTGVLASPAAAAALIAGSRFGSARAEGIIIRADGSGSGAADGTEAADRDSVPGVAPAGATPGAAAEATRPRIAKLVHGDYRPFDPDQAVAENVVVGA